MSQPIHLETAPEGVTVASWILRASDRGSPLAVPLNKRVHIAVNVNGPAIALLDQNNREIEVTKIDGASSHVYLPAGVLLLAPRASDHGTGRASKVEIYLTSTPLASPTPRRRSFPPVTPDHVVYEDAGEVRA
jgi:hypothetical protein